jgi:hypothetical protein
MFLGSLGIACPAVLGLWRLARAPRMFSKDSGDYITALRSWAPLILHRRATPRALKRFLNHLRFLDARQSALEEGQSPLAHGLSEMIKRTNVKTSTDPGAVAKRLSEDQLVCLGV